MRSSKFLLWGLSIRSLHLRQYPWSDPSKWIYVCVCFYDSSNNCMKALHHLDKCEDGHHTDDSTHVIFIEHVQTCSLTRSKEKDMYP